MNEHLAFTKGVSLHQGLIGSQTGTFGTLQRGLYRGSVLTSGVVVKRVSLYGPRFALGARDR